MPAPSCRRRPGRSRRNNRHPSCRRVPCRSKADRRHRMWRCTCPPRKSRARCRHSPCSRAARFLRTRRTLRCDKLRRSSMSSMRSTADRYHRTRHSCFPSTRCPGRCTWIRHNTALRERHTSLHTYPMYNSAPRCISIRCNRLGRLRRTQRTFRRCNSTSGRTPIRRNTAAPRRHTARNSRRRSCSMRRTSSRSTVVPRSRTRRTILTCTDSTCRTFRRRNRVVRACRTSRRHRSSRRADRSHTASRSGNTEGLFRTSRMFRRTYRSRPPRT